jgi:hypothetical protein
VLGRVHLAPIPVKWPERVPEQTLWVIFLLECNQALPILTKGGDHTRRSLVSSEELRVAPLHMRILTLHREELSYRGEGAAARHRFDRFSKPLCHR